MNNDVNANILKYFAVYYKSNILYSLYYSILNYIRVYYSTLYYITLYTRCSNILAHHASNDND